MLLSQKEMEHISIWQFCLLDAGRIVVDAVLEGEFQSILLSVK